MNSSSSLFAWARAVLCLLLTGAALPLASAQSTSTNIISGSIGVPGEQDVYTFNVASRARYYFDSLTNVNSIYWTLEGPSGVVVTRRAFASTDAGSFSPITLPPGFYRLTIDADNSVTNQYAFRFVDLATASLLIPGTQVSSTLSPGPETDLYQFTSAAGDRLLFDQQTTPPGMNVWWRLFDPYDNQVFSGGFSDVNNVTQRVAGVYTLLVEGYSANNIAGAYSFTVVLQGNTPPPPFTGTPMTIGQIVSGSLTNVATNDFTFSLGAETRVVFDNLTNGPSVQWSLDGPPGLVVNNTGINSTDGINGATNLELPAGNYQLRIRHSTAGTVGYRFRLLDLGAGSSVTPGTPILSTLSPASETDVYRFTASAGSRYFFDAYSTNGTGNAYWRLYDLNNVLVTQNSLHSDRGPLTLSISGTYTLVIEGYYDEAGTASMPYRFDVTPITDAVQTLTVGAVTTGAITTPGQSQQYLFSLGSATSLYFDSRTNILRWSLDGPSGNYVNNRGFNASDGLNNSDPRLPLPAGDYTLTVSGNGDATGGFAFRLIDAANATPISPGTPFSSTLSPANETDAYRFTAAAGSKAYFDAVSVNNLPNVYWRCVDSFGTILFSGPLSDRGPILLEAGGTYTLLVEGYHSDPGSGSYTINVLPVVDGTQALTLGEVVSGAIVTPGQAQSYTFTLATTTALYFDVLTNNSTLRWSLQGSVGTIVNNRGFAATDAHNGYAVLNLVAGTYTVTISANGDNTGGYHFRLFDLAPSAPISPGVPVAGTLNPASQTDSYRFTLSAGTKVYFDAITSSGLANVYWRCIDPYGAVVMGNGFSDAGPMILPAGGIYTLVIEGHYPNTDSGTYSFNVVPVNDGSQPLTLGSVVTGQIAVPGQSQRYQFSLPAAATLYLDTLTNSTMRWSLEGPTGLLVNNRGFTSTDANNGYAGLSLYPGNYVLTVNGSGEATGPYQFRVLDLASATPMALGTPVSSSLTPATETDMYRFTVAAGTEVFFDAVAANGIANHYWRCVDPNGAIILVNGFTDFGPVVLQAAGTYTLLMEGYYLNTGSGTYSLNVVPVNDTSPGMTLGNLTSGTIAVPGQAHAYRFTLPASTTLYFDSRTNDSNLRWHLDGPEGRLVNSRGFNASDAQSITDPLLSLSPGDYTLTVFASGDATGNFTFRLFDLATATVLTLGTPVNTTLTPGNETDAYRFTAAAGDRFSFRWLSQTGIPNSYWRLFDPYGNRIFGSGTTDMGTNRLLAAGTYTLLVEGYIADVASGSYQFNVSFVDNVPVSLTGTPMTIGSTVSSNLATANTTNSFTFTLASPTRLFFDSLVNADFRWALTGPAGEMVANRSFQGSDSIDLADSGIQCPAGNYRLNVTGAAGAYSFRLLDSASATAFTPGVVVSSSLAPARSSALHRFTASVGTRFYFDGRPSTGFGLPPYVKIYGPYGIVLPSQQVSTDAEVFTAPHTGNYVVSVEGRYNENGASGNYSFLLQPVVDGTNTITVGSLVVGTIAVPGQRQTHQFNLAVPTSLLFDSLSNVTFRWTLIGPAGVVVDNRALDNSDSYETDALLNLPAGNYRMVVDATGDAVGGYAFRFIDVSTATPLTLGALANGSLAPGNSSVIYRFNANAGDRFYFDGRPTSGFTYTPYLRLYSPLGHVVFGQHAVSSDLDVFTMPHTGSYLLTVEGRWLETSPNGNFSFAFQPVVDGTNTSAVDATFAGVIATPGQRQFHNFNLPSPRRMLFDSLSNVGLRWTLTGPPGVIVSGRTFDSSDSYEIDAMLNLPSGDYVIEVDGSTDATNSYAFRFVDSASAAPFTPGNLVSNSLAPGNSTTLYRFNATAGDRFYFDGRPTSGFTYTPYLRLYSPLGNVVFGQQAVTTDLDTFVVPHSGSYLLSVEGRYPETSVSNQFSFLLQPVVDGTNSITVGQRVNGTIGVTGQRQYYTLNLPAPRQLLFDSLSNVTLRWTLVGPSGTLVNNRSLDNSDSYEVDALMNLPAGDYLMKVDGSASAVGGYAFRFIDTATAVAFTPGTLVTNSLVPGNSSAIYRFNATAGDRFYFDGRPFTGSPYTPYSRIYSPLGAIVLNQQAVNGDTETFPVLETGTFLLTVEGRYIDASPTNSFSFLLAPNPSQAPTPLFETNVAPDLSVIGVAMSPPSGLQSGQSASVQWTTRNTGTAATSGSFVERVTVRNLGTSQVIVNRTLPYDEIASGAILPSQTRARQLIVTLPDGPASVGNLEITVTTDALNTVFEQNAGGTAEANNATSINTTTTLAPYPDLQVALLTTTPVAAWTTGSVVSVSWVVTNSGTRATAGSWTESLLVRNTNTAQIIVNTTTNYAEAEPGNGPIAPNGTRTRSLSFVMPMNANAAGAFEVVLTTDSENQIFEYNAGGSAETNNARSLLSASAPDLVVNGLTATGEPSLQAGSNLRIQWNVANQGNVSADGTFYDRIVVRNTNTAEVLFNTSIPYTPTQAGNGAIQPGGSRPREYFFAMPEGTRAVGRLEVTVTSDVFNSVPEHNGGGTGEANNASQVQVLVAARPYPDLVVTALSGPASGLPGQSVPVVWTIRNNGTVPATNSWSDHLFLSADTIAGNDQFLASIQFSGTLNPSQTLTRTQLVVIPTFGTGARYFVAEVDANSQVFEDNDANNSFVAATPLQLQSSLTLTISPNSVQENAGAQAALATVTRNSAVTSPLTVNLSSSQPAKLLLPANVEIPLGANSANFYVGVVDDLQVGADVVASITVQAAGHINGTNTLTVRENDSPALRLQLSASSVLEDALAGAVTGRVIRNVNTNQALTVTLVSDNPGAMIVPASVVIPIGQTNVTFNLDPVDDDLVSGTRAVSIFASATGFSAVSAPINVLDDDSVALTLTLSDTNVTEGVINPASMATLTRSPVSAALLRVRLGTNSGGLVQIPAEVTIPANQPGVSFPVNVRDDSLSFGAQTVNIVADGLATDGSLIPGSTATATIRIQENDGPTLSVVAAVGVVAEGASTTVTITRNTPPTNALPVTLAAAPAGQANVPTSVVIAVGQFSTNVSLSGVVDGVSDGPREVTVSANSAGFNPGSGLITVTDIDVPDLALSEVSGPTNALTDGVVTAVWSVTNSGLATATGTWVDELLLATDAQGANASVILRVTNAAPIVVGDSYTVARSFLLPSDPGNYWLLVRTDATNSVVEGSERNNSMLSAPISVQPSYRATVSTTVDSAVSGTPIPLAGRTFFTSDGSPAPFRSATVRLNVNRVRRILQVVSDAAGNFQTTFHPIPGEAGVYTVGADHPRVRQDVVQDQFTLLGMSAVPWQISQRLAPNVEASGQIEIRNLSPLPLTGLVADSEGLPLDFNLTVAITNTLAGNATALLDFSFATTISTPVSGRFTLRVTSGEGAVVRIPVDFVVAPPTAQLVAEPASLNRGMLRGAQTTVQFDVVNRGGVASGDLTVALPVAPWMSLVSTSPIPSLAPGARSTVVLGLNPATNLPLTTYSGTIAIIGGQTSLGIPFQFRALSEARGDLVVNATDEHTYFVSGAPKVTNATIVLRDPITHTVTAQSLTDSNGQARFLNLIEGPYILEASAPGHSSTRGGAMVVPGITTEQEVFLTQQSVRYEWKVVPTEIEDHYRVVIEPLFETEVPQPNLIVENPLVIPLVIPGQTTQFEIRLRNSGLIALQRVRIPVPSHPSLIITPLVTEIEELPALASVTVPVTIRVADGGTVADANGIQFRPASGGGCAGTECVVHMPIDTRYKCGPNFVTQQRDVTLQVVCVPDTGCQFDRVDITRVDFMTANNIAGNAEWACLLGKMDECQKARVRGYLKLGDFGAVSGPFGDGISDFCACGPPDKIPQLFNAASNYMASLGFDVDSHDPTAPSIDFGSVGIVTEVPCNQNAPFAAAAAGGFQPASSPPAGTPVCAKVRLQLSQDMTLTRAAFRGTLVLENNGAGPLTDILLEVDFRNAAGASSSSVFAITGPTVVGGLTGVGGSGTLPAGGEGSAEYLFIPTQEAAPLSPTTYFVGGTLRYTEDGRVVTIRLLPGVITVLPEARLTLDYFLQRDVYSDDPFTPELEPAEPFALGLRARNAGAGAARNFRITSAQPRIIENEKGLAIDFQLLGARLGNQPLSPSFSQNLGNVEPGESKIVIWDMTSTIQGKFIDYRASFEHIDALGGRNLSLIESVSIHELIHVVRGDRAGDDTLPDFLVNDAPDPENFPDVVYLSEGGTNGVSRATNPVVDSPPATNDLQVQLTVAMPAGFSYLRMTNPGPNFRLTGVRRSDGKQLLMGPNAWTTDRSFPSAGTGAVREKLLHLFDYNSSGSYTLTFAPINVDTNPPSSTIALLPASSAASFALEWDGDDGAGSGIGFFDIFVSVNGGQFTNWLAHTTLRSGIFTGVMGNSYAFYSVATDLSGNRELIPTGPDAQTSTTGGANTVPSLVPIADVTINEGSLFSLVPTVFDSDVPQQTMTYSLTSSQPGATLDPSSGQITWTTGEAQGGTTNRFTLVVTDNGLPSLSATQSFNVIVREVNSAPFFVNPVDIEVDEESSLSRTIGASDTDLPPNQLTWELAAGAPVGMSLNSANGLLTWLPGESRGPGEYLVSVTVRDNGSPVQSVTRVVRVVVREVNRAPVLAPIATQTALVGSTLYVTNSATDPDVPAQEFFYSIAPGAPRGVRVDRVTGVLSWTPSPAYARTTNSITVRVTDNGVPSLTDTEAFQVIVGDYLEVRLGKTIVLAGQTSSVPVVVATTTPVTNATCIVEFPGTRLGSFNLSPPVAPLASATLQPITANRFLLRFTTLPGQQMAAEQTVSQLRFTAAAGQSSAFVPLTVSNVTATQVNGQPVPRAGGADGRVVYLGPEPLLEMERVNTNGVQLVLYSRPSPSFSVQSTLSLSSPIQWLPFWSGASSNLIDVRVIEKTNTARFFRATLP